MSISRFRERGNYYHSVIVGATSSFDYWSRKWVYPINQYYSPAVDTVYQYREECADALHPGPPYRSGGPLFLSRLQVPWHIAGQGAWIIPERRKYVGLFYCLPLNIKAEYDDLRNSQDAAAYGAKGWNMFRPVKPVNALGQFIAEIRDCKHMVTGLKVRLNSLRAAGHHYLNYRFGWTPFLNDLYSFLTNGKKIARRMAYIRKNNGKWVKRGGTVANSDPVKEDISSANMIYPIIASDFYPGAVITQASRYWTRESHTWFSAMMKYYIPDLPSDDGRNLWSSRLLRKMWGLELTPSLVWELLPWSWMVDWFLDIGNIASNLSNDQYDNLVAKYAYIMQSKTSKLHITQKQPMNGGGALELDDVTFEVTSKERVAASPFGFGLHADWSNLSAGQIAILAALGVTRML